MQPKKELKTRARELELEGQPREALNHYQRLVDRSDDPAPVLWYRIGDLQVGLGEVEAGIDSLSHAVNGFLAEGQVNNAIAMCCRVVEIQPESPGAQLKLGELALQQGYRRDAADAFAAYNRWVVESGDPSDAIYPLTAFLKRFPDEDELWRQWAEDLFGRVGEEKTIGILTDLLASLGSEGGHAAAEIGAEIRVLRGEAPEPPRSEASEEEHGPADLPVLESGAALDTADPATEGGESIDTDFDFGTLEGLEPTSFEASPPEDATPASAPVSRELETQPAEPVEEDEDHFAGDLDIELHQPWIVDQPDAGHMAADDTGTAGSAGDRPTDESNELPDTADTWAADPPETPLPSLDEGPADFNPAAAAARLRNLIEADAERGDDPASHYDLGLAFKEMGLLDQAISHLAHAMEGGHDPVATAEVLGEILVGSGRYGDSAALLEPLRRGAPDGAQMIAIDYWLARTYEGLGRQDLARAGYHDVLSVDPDFLDADQRLRSLGAEAL